MISNADGRTADYVPPISTELRIAERGHLRHPAAILCTDVKAGADLVGNAGAEDAADLCLLLHVKLSCARVADGQKDERARSPLYKWIQVLEDKGANVCTGNFLGAGVDQVLVGVADYIMNGILVGDAVIGFYGARWREHKSIAQQCAKCAICADLNIGR